jgi:hypothetical protein
MTGNATQRGRVYRTRHDDFFYFDQLPPTARQALADAAFNWASSAVLSRWKRGIAGYRTGGEIAQQVARWDRQASAPPPKPHRRIR